MTLYVHRAERADRLVDALGELLATPLSDPFATEIVAVPAKGIERWLTQQLSRRLGRRPGREDGICAGVRFPSPTRLFEDLLGLGDRDPWAPDSLVWPLLDTIDAATGEPWCSVLSTHLGAGGDEAGVVHRRGRRYAVARRLAGLFADYAAQRPGLLTDWAAGRDTDGFGRTLPPDLGWQPELWRRTRSRIDGADPVERLRNVAVGSGPAVLPERVSLFGPTRLPAAHLDLLDRLAADRDVHLWLPHPSPVLWRRIAETDLPGVIRRDADPTILTPEHPLLSSLGRDARELQLTLADRSAVDLHHPAATLPDTLLGRLQTDLREDRRPDTRRPLAPDDRSIQVHACHGASRQVDVLREILVGLLAADPTLEPRDVLVMCPDIEVYAPLVAAAFGLADLGADGHPAHRLRVRLADRALVQTNPLLATVATLLDLADARITASQLLDLAAWPPVRRRFRFTDDDLETVARWTAESGVRWGLDAAHRQPFGLAQFPQGTWRSGLDRVLLGATMADEGGWLGLALPVDDVGSGDVDLAGRLAELVSRLHLAVDLLRGPKPVTGWLDALATAVASLTAVSDDDSWQQGELDREFADIAAGAGPDTQTPLRLPDVRALLAGRLGGRPTRANFRTGNLTVCTMVPMRSVPHRVVCLIGLDDGVFPRAAHPDGDDVLARDPVVGERDRRGEDRQLLLDALLAATETVVITYTGADERTGAARPPSVPIGELLDTLDDMAVTTDGEPARSQVLVRHPLQPFDLRNVIPGRLGVPGPFSYDPAVLAAARAAAGPRESAPLFLPQPLPDLPPGDLDLDRLIGMLTNPARGFLRQRLDVAVRFEESEPSDALPVELDALQQWAIGDRLLRDRLAGQDPDASRQAEWRRGTLPPGPLGQRILGTVMADVDPLVNATAGLRVAERGGMDIEIALGDRRLTGTVSGLHDTTLVAVGYSRLGPKARLQAWIQLMALTVAHPTVDWTAVTVGRGSGAPEQSTLGSIEPTLAREVLTQLVDLHDRGMRAPLPLPLKTGAAYAEQRFRRRSPEDALNQARLRWVSDKFPGEDADPAFVRIWGPAAPFADIHRELSRPDEHWMREPSRFAELAVRLWFPLLTVERRESL